MNKLYKNKEWLIKEYINLLLLDNQRRYDV